MENRLRDMFLTFCEFQILEKLERFFDRPCCYFANILSSDFYVQIGLLEAISMTTSTHLFLGETPDTFDISIIPVVSLLISTIKIRDETLISSAMHLSIIILAYIRHFKGSWNAIEDFLSVFFWQFSKWFIYINSLFATDGFNEYRIIWMIQPWLQCALTKSEIRTHNILFTKSCGEPKSMTCLARPMMGVK